MYIIRANGQTKFFYSEDKRCENALVAPRNDAVDDTNAAMLECLEGPTETYYSTDVPFEEPNILDVHIADHDVHTLNMHPTHQLPPHVLNLKVGAPVTLLRNVETRAGICNGTRAIITFLGRDIIQCRIKTKSSIMYNQIYTLCRHRLEYDDTGPNKSGLHFFRTQFPVRLAFATSITKSQGCTLSRVGISLETDVFAPGQLYVALSRVRNIRSIAIWAPHAPRVNGKVRIKNIVARGLKLDG